MAQNSEFGNLAQIRSMKLEKRQLKTPAEKQYEIINNMYIGINMNMINMINIFKLSIMCPTGRRNRPPGETP